DSDVSLARAVAGLEQKLASVRSNQQRLTEENAKLREQLRAAQESLAQAQERAAADTAAVRLDSAEIRLLERLLSPLRDKRPRREGGGAGCPARRACLAAGGAAAITAVPLSPRCRLRPFSLTGRAARRYANDDERGASRAREHIGIGPWP